jgi:release factor glutamine methyltransferase
MNNFQLLNEYFSSKLFQLEKIEIDEHKKKSELLIEDILGINKSDIYTKNYYIPHEKIELLEHAFSQLKENTPVQHILGKSYFYNDEFFTPPGTFIPRPETELIVDCIRNDFSRLEKKNVLEIGSGTGCLSITNAKKLNCSNIKFIKQDFFKMNFNRYDIVISNPPYLALEEVGFLDESVKNHDPLMALSDNKDGLSFYKFFVNNIDLFLEKDGSMYFEIPNSSITEIIIELVKNNQKINSKIFKDFEGNNRVIKIY